MSATNYTLPPLPLPGAAAFASQVEAYGHACAEATRNPLLGRIAELEHQRAALVEALQNIRSTLHRNGWATDQADAALRAAGVATESGLGETL